MVPYLEKNIKETDIMPFPWEENIIQELSIEEELQLQNDVEKSKAFWDAWDAKKLAKA